MNKKTIKALKKLKETENNRKSLEKEMLETRNWERTKKLIDKDWELDELENRRQKKLSGLLKVRVWSG